MDTNFQRIWVCRSVQTVHTKKSICKNIVSCINLQIAIRIFLNHAFLTCTTGEKSNYKCLTIKRKKILKIASILIATSLKDECQCSSSNLPLK